MAEKSRYPIYCRGLLPGDPHSRMMVPIFEELPQARAFVESFMAGEEYERDGNVLRSPQGFTLKAEQLGKILAADLGELPDRYEKLILRFKYGHHDGVSAKDAQEAVTKREPRVERERRPERPDGFVTISDLAALWNMPATHARAALRASGREKPSYGWAFDPKEVDAIKELCGIK